MTPELMEEGARRASAHASGGRAASLARPVVPGEVDIAHGRILYLEDVSVSFDGFRAIDKLSLDGNWPSLAAVPGETLMRLMQERVGDAQAVAQAAVTNQTRFLTGLQDAFLMWQRDTAKAMGSVEAAKPFNAALGDFFKLFANATTTATGSGHEH